MEKNLSLIIQVLVTRIFCLRIKIIGNTIFLTSWTGLFSFFIENLYNSNHFRLISGVCFCNVIVFLTVDMIVFLDEDTSTAYLAADVKCSSLVLASSLFAQSAPGFAELNCSEIYNNCSL